MFIEQPAPYLRWLYPHALWRMDRHEKAVYLTFDDGPIPEATPFILDTLAHYGIKATFFVVGDNVRKHPDLFRRVVAEGHRIGNHTFNHIGGFKYLSKNYLKNAEKAQAIIEKVISEGVNCEECTSLEAHHAQAGADSNTHSSPFTPSLTTSSSRPLFRPPHGWMRHDQYQTLKKHYRVVMWDLVTRDYSYRLTAADIVANVKRYARNGSIITFHDSLRSIEKLHTALPESLEWLIAQGYAFRTID
ncbi:MAG: polysaccharide deacetylase family protein [Bacteroidaceae bacterium]|nr:polysaccharide deacetylase family protein [Bacteroidaceae bacterium]